MEATMIEQGQTNVISGTLVFDKTGNPEYYYDLADGTKPMNCKDLI